jgi:3-hydroxyacyl-[acyl-carrier-protein] dehydratase
MSQANTQEFPFTLDRQAIERLLPHRGPIFACKQIIATGPRAFTATANWPLDNAIIAGHFPGNPVVPGVMLIEAMSQLAGAGLLSADPYVKSIPGDRIGVLASVRRCLFKQPVMPGQDVQFKINCRQIGAHAVQVSGQALVNDSEVGQLETLIVYVEKTELSHTMSLST